MPPATHSTEVPLISTNKTFSTEMCLTKSEQNECKTAKRNCSVNSVLQDDHLQSTPKETSSSDDTTEFRPEIRWPDLLAQVFIHAGCLYGLYLLFFVKLQTIAWFLVIIVSSGFGITAGAHRLWSHKSYKAKLPLRWLLLFLFTIAGQRDAYTWALDHRVHHKYSETDADPHNAKRGFFFAHVGWLFVTPHPKVVEKRKIIDMSDLEADGIVMWQKKYYIPLFALITIGLPVLVPWYFWNEDLWNSFWVNFNCRFCVTLNIAFFVNSVAHMWGRKPYDSVVISVHDMSAFKLADFTKKLLIVNAGHNTVRNRWAHIKRLLYESPYTGKYISPVENFSVAIAALGEGWHNYHHVFPWDYKTSEFGDYKFNLTTGFIDTFAKIGWVYGRKYVSPDMIARRAAKCGDGTHFLNDDFAHNEQCWGYGDEDIPKEDKDDLEAMSD